MRARAHLLSRLADGRFHSGQQLADAMGVSRSAVWKQVRRLESELGLRIYAVRGRGYRLAKPLEILDLERIRRRLGPDTFDSVEAIHLLSSTASTNSCAADDLPVDIGMARIWLAEHQSGGRGRRGRQWVSPFGENLYLTVAWRFDLPMTELAGLSLITGVVVAEVLEQFGLRGHSLKWPNDVLVAGRKLAGILVEASGEAGGPSTAALGVGINFRLSDAQGEHIEQPWTDLARASEQHFSRNEIAGLLIDRLVHACRQFSTHRLAPFLDRWRRFDDLTGESVRIIRGGQPIEGVYRGIASSGALVLENENGRREFHAGEVSLRKGDEA